MQTGKLIRIFMVMVLLTLVAVPTAVFAGFDGKGTEAVTDTAVYQHSDEAEEEATMQEGSDDGVGFVLAFLAGIIFLIIAVVAIISAVGLGIIGIGYWQSSPSEE